MTHFRRLRAAALLLAAVLLLDALWLERRVLLFEDDVRIDLDAPRLRVVHLSDLHLSRRNGLYRRLLARVATARPDLIVVSGDFIQDVPDLAVLRPRIAETAAFAAQLRRIAPVIGVQGHSEHQGEVVTALKRVGVELLSNEGKRIGKGRGMLLLGLNQQVGNDELAFAWPSPFHVYRLGGRLGNRWYYGARRGEQERNFYSHWDPAPMSGKGGLTDESGPYAWSGYDAVCDVRIEDANAGAGLVVHSRFPLGEDRMIRLSRDKGEHGGPSSFLLWSRGTAFTGGKADDLDTGVVPKPRRWYRMRLRTEVEPDVVRAMARVWPADGPEPRVWQAHAEDRSPWRIPAGTVGVWAWGGGTVLYRDLRVIDRSGEGTERTLLAAPLSGTGPAPARPPGFLEGARGTRLALALARSPLVPPGTPRIVLSHTPSVALEASLRGIDAVLAGHTHGGQVRLPFFGALTVRDSLGAAYGYGRFDFAAPNARGYTTLFVNGGIGTSLLPIRFWCPPRFAVIEIGR